jgi:hypothetical protein
VLGLFRALGLLALAGAFAAAVMDGAASLANDTVSLTSLGAALARLAPAKFAELPALVGKSHPWLWDPVLLHLLYIPVFVALAVVGAALTLLGRRRG